ncbi:MAG: hypothetical protein KA096_00775 [Bacteroidales bacterium]|nr:hypothetical protein [Bacteroidales bacterium]
MIKLSIGRGGERHPEAPAQLVTKDLFACCAPFGFHPPTASSGFIVFYKSYIIGFNWFFFTPEELHFCSKGDGTRTIFPSRDNPVFQGNISMGGD